ncbi:hypothetical protein MMC09_004921 [Bachmanniomyces sp. S44760]|nr:hypothetical protein [Bachmanniomyces sp. S44760]
MGIIKLAVGMAGGYGLIKASSHAIEKHEANKHAQQNAYFNSLTPDQQQQFHQQQMQQQQYQQQYPQARGYQNAALYQPLQYTPPPNTSPRALPATPRYESPPLAGSYEQSRDAGPFDDTPPTWSPRVDTKEI